MISRLLYRAELPIFLRKICINCSVPKTNLLEYLNPHVVSVGYFIYDHICNPNLDYDLKY